MQTFGKIEKRYYITEGVLGSLITKDTKKLKQLKSTTARGASLLLGKIATHNHVLPKNERPYKKLKQNKTPKLHILKIKLV